MNGFTRAPEQPWFPARRECEDHHMTCLYEEYEIEPFEAGRGLWHARIRRADRRPIVIGRHPFSSLEVGFAWPDANAAIDDARRHIDRFGHRWATAEAVDSAA